MTRKDKKMFAQAQEIGPEFEHLLYDLGEKFEKTEPYRLTWIDSGKTSIIYGVSIDDALKRAGLTQKNIKYKVWVERL